MQFPEEVKSYTCIRCPLGCQLEVSFDTSGTIQEVSGYSCAKGKEYALEEATDPRRTLTSLVYAQSCLEPVSVKTSKAIPKAKIDDVSAAIHELCIEAPVKAGDILIENVCDTGVDVVATKSIGCSEQKEGPHD